MKPTFQVQVLRFAVLKAMEDAWTPADYTSLLEEMEFDDTAGMTPEELREMCVLSLQDLKPAAAAALLLKHRFGPRLRDGQVANFAPEMMEEKMWEQCADMSLHEDMFHVGSLLYAASPDAFPEPDAVRVTLEVTAGNDAARPVLAHSLNESFIVRLLADGMDSSRSSLHRLFDEQLEGKSFPEADRIVWIVRTEVDSPKSAKVEVTSSGYWLDALRETKSYESSAYPDASK